MRFAVDNNALSALCGICIHINIIDFYVTVPVCIKIDNHLFPGFIDPAVSFFCPDFNDKVIIMCVRYFSKFIQYIKSIVDIIRINRDGFRNIFLGGDHFLLIEQGACFNIGQFQEKGDRGFVFKKAAC